MIKAIFFDIDGTLMSFKTYQMPHSTLNALNKLKEKGILLFIATGRSPKELEPFLSTINFKFDGYITMNGQLCYSDEVIFNEDFIDIKEIESAIDYLDQKQIGCSFFERDYVYTNRITEQVIALYNSLNTTIDDVVIDTTDRIYSHKVYQLCPFINEDQEEAFLASMPSCKAARWHPLFVDIILKESGKPKGIQKVIDYYHIDQTETMAFGDGGNDMDMLRFVEIGIAMGNASDKVKTVSDYVTTSVDEDGIALALKHFNIVD